MDKSKLLIQIMTTMLIGSMINDLTILQKSINRNKALTTIKFEKKAAVFQYDIDETVLSNRPAVIVEREQKVEERVVTVNNKEKNYLRNRTDIIYALKEKNMDNSNSSTHLAMLFDSLCGTIIYSEK